MDNIINLGSSYLAGKGMRTDIPEVPLQLD